MTNTVLPSIQTQFISHQQAVAEHWDLPNTEIFSSPKMSLLLSSFWMSFLCTAAAAKTVLLIS
jgi:hypothetical protein